MDELLRVGRVCALVLAGGRSERMGSDKALLRLGGDTLLERAVRFWQGVPMIQSVIVSVGTDAHFDSLPDGVFGIADEYPGCGPMAGLHAAFSRTDAELIYVSAVDMPFLTPDALPREPDGDAAVYGTRERPEPLFGVYRRSALPYLTSALEAGERKMSELLKKLRTEYIPLPDDRRRAVSNLNTRADVLRALAGTPPLILCTGWSGSGKTTFLEKLLPELCKLDLRVAVIKHDAHGFSMDTPGKDTYRLAEAGAVCTAISGPNGWAIISRDEIELEALREKLPPVDIIIGEGSKYAPYPKIEVHRRATGKPFITHDHTLLAAVTDEPVDADAPQFSLDDAAGCAALILETFFPESNTAK